MNNNTLMTTPTHSIVVLAASPQPQGNGAKLQDAFVQGLREQGGDALHISMHRLHDMQIDAYSYPARRTPGDDEPALRALLQEVAQASGLVIITPTFNFAVPPVLKAFVDRLSTVSLDYKRPLRPGRPAPLLRRLPVQALVTAGSPRWVTVVAFFLYPGLWLSAALAYFGAAARVRTFAGLSPAGSGPSPRQLAAARRLGARLAHRVLARPPLAPVALPW